MSKKHVDIPELNQPKNLLGKISELFIDRYRTVYLILIAILLVGWISYNDLPRESIPQVESNIIAFSVPYLGASPSDVEQLVADPIEDAIRGLDDLSDYSSTSSSGLMTMMMNYEFGIDMAEALDEVKKAVDGVELPDGAEEPVIIHFKTDMIPILTMSLTGDADSARLTDAADNLKVAFEAVKGIDEVTVSGDADPIVRIAIDPLKLENYGVSASQIQQSLQAANIGIPAGEATLDGNVYNMRVEENFTSVDDVANTMIMAGQSVFRLSDVADVYASVDMDNKISRTYRQEAGNQTTPVIFMSVFREAGADTIGPANEILQIIEDGKGTLYNGDFDVIINSNFAEDVEDDLANVMDSAIAGLLVVILVLFLFIDLREALIVALVIPTSLFIGMILMRSTGVTFNTISLMGFVIALGLLVDNAIVVIENIDRIRDFGLDRKTAAKIAINQVAPAVMAATLTTLAAFVPLAMTPGMLGLMLRSLPLTILYTIGSSFIISLIVTPTIAARFLGRYKETMDGLKAKTSNLRKWLSVAAVAVLALFAFRIDGEIGTYSYIGAIGFSMAMYIKQFRFKHAHGHGAHIEAYGNWLAGVMKSTWKRVVILVTAFVLLIAAVALVPLGYVPLELLPNEEPSSMTVNVELPIGSKLGDTEAIVGQVEERLFEMENVDNFTSNIGSGASGTNSLTSDQQNTASIQVELIPEEERTINGFDMVTVLRQELANIPGADMTVDAALDMGGPPGSSVIDIRLTGASYDELRIIALEYKNILENIPGAVDVTTDAEAGLPEIIIDIDPTLAAAKGLTTAGIAQDIRAAFSGTDAGEFRIDGVETKIKIEWVDQRIDNVADLHGLQFTTQTGNKVNFGEVAKVVEQPGISRIQHQDGEVVVRVQGNNAPDANVNAILQEFREKAADLPVPTSLNVEYGGELEQMNEAFGDMGYNFMVALLLVYIILSVQFNSLTQPVVILLSVPLGLIGTMFGLALTGNSLGFYSLFGVVSLVGIAVNDAIVLVDYANYLRKEGMERNKALIDAVKTRFNPVLATSITTIGGVLPMSVAEPSLGQLGWALIFGLVASTVLTLMIIPIVYSLNDGAITWVKKKLRLFQEEDVYQNEMEALDEA